MQKEPVENETYLHYSRGVYHVLAVALHSDTNTKHVIFHAPDRPAEVYTRPLEDFMGQVYSSGVKIDRFTKIEVHAE